MFAPSERSQSQFLRILQLELWRLGHGKRPGFVVFWQRGNRNGAPLIGVSESDLTSEKEEQEEQGRAGQGSAVLIHLCDRDVRMYRDRLPKQVQFQAALGGEARGRTRTEGRMK